MCLAHLASVSQHKMQPSTHCGGCTCAGVCVQSLTVGAAVSGPVVFDGEGGSAYVVTLSGTVMALLCTTATAHAGGGQSGVKIDIRWTHAALAAIFSAPAVASLSASLVCASVDGSIFSLGLQAGVMAPQALQALYRTAVVVHL